MGQTAPVSVIIPHHNRSQFLGSAIDSILAQTLQPAEIVIVDDASSPAHLAALDRFRAHARIIAMPENVGAAKARTKGVDEARGEFIAFLDDDDLWYPHKLELQYGLIRADPSLEAIAGSMTIRYRNGLPDVLLRSHSPEIITLKTALAGTPALFQTLLIRSNAMRRLMPLDSSFRVLDDRDFWIRFAAAGFRARYLAEPAAYLNRDEAPRLTGNWKRMLDESLRIVDKHEALYATVHGPDGPRLERSRIYRRAGHNRCGIPGRLAYARGCVMGAAWPDLFRLCTTGKMTELGYAAD